MFLRSQVRSTALSGAAFAATAILFSASAHAAGDPRGIWYDHNGRGAVEIKECSANPNRLCGHVVYVKKSRHKKRCGMQIIGNVRKNGRGWIYSPSRGRSYPLAVKRLSDSRLRIVGNAGSFFTKTYIWKRAPDTIANCNQPTLAKKKDEPVKAKAAQPVALETTPANNTSPDTNNAKPETKADDLPTASTATAALLATPIVAEPEPEPEATEVENKTGEPQEVNDLAPPGGLSKGEGNDLGKLKSVIKKFAGGKNLDDLNIGTSGGKKCKFRIPYVGRTIRVPCK